MNYYAHSDFYFPGKLPDEDDCHWQTLHEHLYGVEKLAKAFAEAARGDDIFIEAARRAGLLHDIGKYSDAFQQLLYGAADGRPRARVEHSGHGAAIAFNAKAYDIALAVAGHHSGLGSPSEIRERVNRLQNELEYIIERAKNDLGEEAINFLHGTLDSHPDHTKKVSCDMLVRMIFSCLVDADRIDTAGSAYQPHVLSDALARLQRLLAHVKKQAASLPPGLVRDARRSVLESCMAAAEWEDRLLSLTVPTGGGKTLSSMAFALQRASLRPSEARRIIVVIPFLSIIEQNAKVFSEAIGGDAIIEHHSGNLIKDALPEEDYDPQNRRNLSAIENWNAPVIVTTSVRFFDSLFSNRPSDLRRLHNVARSIVILDEVQTLPRHLLRALLSAMHELSRNWGTTFVFCTATQPAFEKPAGALGDDPRWEKGMVKEIVADPKGLFRKLKRVEVCWPGKDGRAEKCSWDEVAEWMASEPRALCVVNLKKHASLLYSKLQEKQGLKKDSLWHLSTRMCPQHRLDVLDSIRAALDDPGRPCRVVSTQLVEAGVDLDFPVVFRAMGPFDSIIQAAGRCDREGKLTASRGQPGGKVIVFEPDDPSGKVTTPPGAYRDATEVTKTMLSAGREVSIHDHAHIRGFFNRYYDPSQSDLDSHDIVGLRNNLDFREIAKRFSMIEESTVAILVPYDKEAERLIEQVKNQGGLDMELSRKLQRYQVGLYPQEFEQAKQNGAIYELLRGSDIWCCEQRFYSRELGFTLESDEVLMA